MKTSLLALVVVVVLALAGCKNRDATPAGYIVLEWSIIFATRPGFGSATTANHGLKDVIAEHRTRANKGTVALDVRFEIAEVSFPDDGKTVKHTAPVGVRARVRDAADFNIQAKCLDGPNYQRGTVDAKGVMQTPLAMVLQCEFTLTRGPDWTETFSLDLVGDGFVKSTFEDGTEIK